MLVITLKTKLQSARNNENQQCVQFTPLLAARYKIFNITHVKELR